MRRPQRGVICPGCPHRAAYVVVKDAVGRGRGRVTCGDAGCSAVGAVHPAASACAGGQDVLLPRYNQPIPTGFAEEPGALRCAHFVNATAVGTDGGAPSAGQLAMEGSSALLCVMASDARFLTEPGVTGLAHELESLGYERTSVLDPFDTSASGEAIAALIDTGGAHAVTFSSPCAQLLRRRPGLGGPAEVDRLSCVGCQRCVQITGCPALSFAPPSAQIDPVSCTGCDLCADYCRTRVIFSPRTGESPAARQRRRFEAAGIVE
ncbi:hypothetical protein [Collinsella vaginalis]|uniref:hypothetical protein n=1 Tax=Collinsella vaginalis TaxID=1870987 RepID=UPI00117D48DF|nr:hypothetical protein [Collinsella vaginalis]